MTIRTKQVLLIFGFAILSLFYLCGLSTSRTRLPHALTAASLEVFQVYQPVLVPSVRPSDASRGTATATATATVTASDGNDSVHTSVLMDHVFAFSYGDPFVG